MTESTELMIVKAVARELARQERERKDAQEAQEKREAVRAEIISDLFMVNVNGTVEGISDGILAGRVRHVKVVF